MNASFQNIKFIVLRQIGIAFNNVKLAPLNLKPLQICKHFAGINEFTSPIKS